MQEEPVLCQQPGLHLQTQFSLCRLALLWLSGALVLPISQDEVMIRLTVSSKPKVPL